jgi:hypothetical protein
MSCEGFVIVIIYIIIIYIQTPSLSAYGFDPEQRGAKGYFPANLLILKDLREHGDVADVRGLTSSCRQCPLAVLLSEMSFGISE